MRIFAVFLGTLHRNFTFDSELDVFFDEKWRRKLAEPVLEDGAMKLRKVPLGVLSVESHGSKPKQLESTMRAFLHVRMALLINRQ